jgi:CBS domain-containing protein
MNKLYPFGYLQIRNWINFWTFPSTSRLESNGGKASTRRAHSPALAKPTNPEDYFAAASDGDECAASSISFNYQEDEMKQTCRDIMTKDPFCCTPMDSAQRAAQLMRDRNVGAVPVCESEETKRLVGIVTDRDLTLRVVAEGCDPTATCLGDVMTRQVFTCNPEDSVDKALELMERHQVRRIPVVDQQNRIVGIITQGDIALRLRDPQKIAEVVVEVSKPSMAAA